jgi:hypothetical protein
MNDFTTTHQRPRAQRQQTQTINPSAMVPPSTRIWDDAPTSAMNHSRIVARGTAVMGLFGVALIHLLDAGSKYSETPYLFWGYLALIATSLTLAVAHIHRDLRLAWLATALLPALTMIGYGLSRTTGLPGAMGDIGNWSEPLGLASLLVEGFLVALSVYRLTVLARPLPGRKQTDADLRVPS